MLWVYIKSTGKNYACVSIFIVKLWKELIVKLWYHWKSYFAACKSYIMIPFFYVNLEPKLHYNSTTYYNSIPFAKLQIALIWWRALDCCWSVTWRWIGRLRVPWRSAGGRTRSGWALLRRSLQGNRTLSSRSSS